MRGATFNGSNDVDTTQTITHVSLCAGYGGIDLGLHRAIRNLRTIAVSEIEAFACANLVAKMEAGLLDCAPIWTDLKTFPWAEFRDRVDILSGGYPCQPFSAAGKRLGAEDPRHLWPFISAGIALMRPAVCFFENVEGHISLGLRDVLQDLVGLGYRATWCVASASECGAPHQRKRIWILAHRHGERGQLPDWWREAAEQVPVGYGETWRDELMANAMCERRQQDAGSTSRNEEANGREGWNQQQPDGDYVTTSHVQGAAWPSRPGEQQFAWEPPRVVANTGSAERRTRAAAGDITNGTTEWQEEAGPSAQSSELADDISGKLIGRPGIGINGRKRQPEQAEASLSRGLGHDAAIKTQPPLGRDADGPADRLDDAELYTTCDNRTDELRLLGNGVVPACAERAFRLLVGELMEHQP
jgi:DNA (cytosine-5)-methyltransferase 1